MAEPRYRGKPQPTVVCPNCGGVGAKPGTLSSLSQAKTPDDVSRIMASATCPTCRGKGRIPKEPA